ncbi:calcium-binding protein 7 [Tachysurus ichikawai]
MPMHPVTSTLMYRGICTIPDILSYGTPVNLPEDELEVFAVLRIFPDVACTWLHMAFHWHRDDQALSLFRA